MSVLFDSEAAMNTSEAVCLRVRLKKWVVLAAMAWPIAVWDEPGVPGDAFGRLPEAAASGAASGAKATSGHLEAITAEFLLTPVNPPPALPPYPPGTTIVGQELRLPHGGVRVWLEVQSATGILTAMELRASTCTKLASTRLDTWVSRLCPQVEPILPRPSRNAPGPMPTVPANVVCTSVFRWGGWDVRPGWEVAPSHTAVSLHSWTALVPIGFSRAWARPDSWT